MKNKKIIKKQFNTIKRKKVLTLYALFGFLIFLTFGYMHEVIHQKIYENYGIESKIVWNFPDLQTISEKPCPTDLCFQLNATNEIIGYPLLILFLLIYSGFYGIIFILSEKKGVKK
jgi:hypothetical protein